MDSSFKFIRFHICNTKTPTSNFKVKFMIHSSDNIIKEITSDLRDAKIILIKELN
ncbi:hypothetical protein [Borreliella valaisiana]|uniref:hypothetical protein n=1 Tax=Borreliella valaisiana TaxID=62088 RepID=UPI002ED17EC4